MVVNCTLTIRDKSYSVRSWRRDTFQRTILARAAAAASGNLQATCLLLESSAS